MNDPVATPLTDLQIARNATEASYLQAIADRDEQVTKLGAVKDFLYEILTAAFIAEAKDKDTP